MTIASRFLSRIGRLLLWLALLFLLVQGAMAILAAEPGTDNPVRPATVAHFPDDAARAFAASFARAYVASAAGASAETERALAPYLAPGLDVGGSFPRSTRYPLSVLLALPAGSVRLDESHALVDVALDVAGGTPRYLAVPVVRDGEGRLAVFARPSFVPPPAVAATGLPSESAPLEPQLRSQLVEMLSRFFVAYLTGRDADLSYFAPPGIQLRAVGGGFRDVRLADLSLLQRRTAADLLVATDVRAVDTVTGTSFLLTYRVDLVRRSRWYVAAVNAN
jgi:hypothetical protein